MATTETPVSPATETPEAVAAAPAAAAPVVVPTPAPTPAPVVAAPTPAPAAPAPSAPKAPKVVKAHAPAIYIDIPVKDIITKAGENVRTGELPDIEELAKTIEADGLLEPILVTAAADVPGKYRMVAGWRRLTAVRSLGYPTISSRVVDADTDRRLRLALIENIQKVDMSALDKANGIATLLKNTKLEQQEVAQALGVAPGYISQYLAILQLPQSALDALRDGDISFTQARTLCRLIPNTKAINDLVFEASDLTVAQLETKVTHLVALAKDAAAEAEAEAEEEEGDDAPKKKKAAKAAPTDKDVEYYTEADFRPLKKEDIRELMISYKRKEVNAETEAKRAEFRLILKGITLAADLRLK